MFDRDSRRGRLPVRTIRLRSIGNEVFVGVQADARRIAETTSWAGRHHWLVSTYNDQGVFHFCTAKRALKVGRQVYRTLHCPPLIWNNGIMVHGVFQGTLMGPESVEYHRMIRAIANYVDDRTVIEMRKLDMIRTDRWRVAADVFGLVREPKIDGLQFSFNVTRYWVPDPAGLKHYYLAEAKKHRVLETIRMLGSVARSHVRWPT